MHCLLHTLLPLTRTVHFIFQVAGQSCAQCRHIEIGVRGGGAINVDSQPGHFYSRSSTMVNLA